MYWTDLALSMGHKFQLTKFIPQGLSQGGSLGPSFWNAYISVLNRVIRTEVLAYTAVTAKTSQLLSQPQFCMTFMQLVTKLEWSCRSLTVDRWASDMLPKFMIAQCRKRSITSNKNMALMPCHSLGNLWRLVCFYIY